MQVSVETGEGLERRIRIDLPFEEVDSEIEKRLQQLARKIRLPGFRPGKVPMKVLRQRYAEHVQQEVFGDLVQSSLTDAMSREPFRPAGMPRIEPDIDLAEKRVGFTAIFEVMPEFELAALSEQVVKRPVSTVTDADLDAMIEQLRQQNKTWEAVERPCQTGDQLTVSFAGTVDGEAFEGGSTSGLKLELGAGRMIPGFEDGLIGASTGEQRTLDLTFPEPYQAAHLAGKPVRFEVTVDAVAEPKVPEIEDEFLQRFGVEDGDVERFKAEVRRNMERELKERLRARTKEQVMDILFAANPIELPKSLVRQEMESMADQMRQALGGARMELPVELFETGARRRVALGLILGKIISEQALTADSQRVREMIEHMASTYENPQEFVDYHYADRSRLGAVETLALEEQVVDLLLEQIKVEEEPVSFEELTHQGTMNPSALG